MGYNAKSFPPNVTDMFYPQSDPNHRDYALNECEMSHVQCESSWNCKPCFCDNEGALEKKLFALITRLSANE